MTSLASIAPTDPAGLLFLLLCGHALADFSLQNEWVATNKNPRFRLTIPIEKRQKLQVIWPHLMTAHALHHGLMVALITQRISLGIAETVVHWISDYGKCNEWYGFHFDQFVHVACKVLWVILIVRGLV